MDLLLALLAILILILLCYFCKCKYDNFGNDERKSDRELKFIHIPKTGGTSVVLWGIENGYNWGRKDSNKPECNTKDGKWHCPAEYWDPKHEYFCIVRDPYSRLVSEANYENLLRRKKGLDDINPEGLNDFLVDMITKHSDNMRETTHYIPQYKYVYKENGEPLCTHIIKYENLNSEFKKLLNTDKNLKKAMTGDGINKIEHLNNKTKELIRKVYAKDFEIYESLK